MLSKVNNVTFTFTFSKMRGSLNNYQFIHAIKCKRCIIPYETQYWKLLVKVYLRRIFIHHSLLLPMKWKIFLVPLWVLFVFEKIKNKTLQNGFFSWNCSISKKWCNYNKYFHMINWINSMNPVSCSSHLWWRFLRK